MCKSKTFKALFHPNKTAREATQSTPAPVAPPPPPVAPPPPPPAPPAPVQTIPSTDVQTEDEGKSGTVSAKRKGRKSLRITKDSPTSSSGVNLG